MKHSRKITIISIAFLLLCVCLAAGCKNETTNTASNQNTREDKAQTASGDGTIVDSSDINGPSANAKPVPGGTTNHTSSTPTPKSSATPNIATTAKTPQPEPTKSNESDVAAKSQSSSAPIKYVLGPRGNCYFTNENGKKIYVARSMCGVGNETNNPPRQNISQPSGDTRQYILGPKGRCFFMDSSGQKVFVAKTRCGQ